MSKIVDKAKITIKKIDRKHGSKILIIGGTVTSVAAIAFAIKKSFKATEIIDSHNLYREKIDNDLPIEVYSKDERSKPIRKLYLNTGLELTKTYALPVGLELLSITMFYMAFSKERDAKLGYISALNSITTAFAGYRKAVAERIGESEELELYQGRHAMTVTDMETKEEKQVRMFDPSGYSVYSRFFDETNEEWKNDPQYNLYWLNIQQNIWNDKLHRDGLVFLNDVYKSLGFEKVPEGQYIGWALAAGDSYIDFGMFDGHRERVRDFVNGYEPSVLLTFPNLSGKDIIQYL